MTTSSTVVGSRPPASSETFLASAVKMSQSDFDSHAGGTAACIGLMNVCMSVVLRSSFSYQVAAGRTMSSTAPTCPCGS